MNYAADREAPPSPRFKEFIDELGELARKHGFTGVAVATFLPGGCELAAMGDDEHYPAAEALVDAMRSAIYLRGPPAGNA